MNKTISIIIPVYNAGNTIVQCLEAIYRNNVSHCEVIVVNDASSDSTAIKLRQFPCLIVNMDKRSGAGAARNEGARHASGDILFFLDADVLVQPGFAGKIMESFSGDNSADVLQGLYTKEGAAKTLTNRFVDHYMYYQTSRIKDKYLVGVTSYCFAIKKNVFELIKGFDASKNKAEDVDLGCRLTQKGHKILLNRDLRVAHARKDTLGSFLSNIYGKVYAKTRLQFDYYFQKKNGTPNGDAEITFTLTRKKNMKAEIFSAVLSLCIAISLLGGILCRNGFLLYSAAIMITIFLLTNSSLFNSIRKERGAWFTFRCFLVFYAELLTAMIAAIKAVIDHCFARGK